MDQMKLSEYYRTAPIAKPEPRQKAKDRDDRREAQIVKQVRRHDVDRDGYCRVQSEDPDLLTIVGPCAGLSEWAHLEDQRRGRTMGQPPEQRHTSGGTAMLCNRHHTAYDAFKWAIEHLTTRGADGPIRIYTETREYREG
jgi:hypothetical protein